MDKPTPDYPAILAQMQMPRSAEERQSFKRQTWKTHQLAGKSHLNWHRVRQHNRCAYCDVQFVSFKRSSPKHLQPTLDHKVPRKEGGTVSVDNTCAACKGCNTAKADMSVEEFRTNFHHYRQRVRAVKKAYYGEGMTAPEPLPRELFGIGRC